MSNEVLAPQLIGKISDRLYQGVSEIIDDARRRVAVYVNTHSSMTFWNVGKYIIDDMEYQTYSAYGQKILATLSQKLTARYGKGFSYSAVTRMIMAYERSMIAVKPDDEIVKTLENTSPKHIEPDVLLKSSYVLDFLGLSGYYSEEELENAIAKQLEYFILELGQGFAFLERQKRFTIDGTDYYLDLLFYHRKLKCLVAIDLKLGKFKPQYKGQMELYLKYMQKYDMQPDENPPIGLLLCSEGNTEHIELLMLGEENIKVGQYLTYLPDKQWFIDKLNRSILIAKEYN